MSQQQDVAGETASLAEVFTKGHVPLLCSCCQALCRRLCRSRGPSTQCGGICFIARRSHCIIQCSGHLQRCCSEQICRQGLCMLATRLPSSECVLPSVKQFLPGLL